MGDKVGADDEIRDILESLATHINYFSSGEISSTIGNVLIGKSDGMVTSCHSSVARAALEFANARKF